MKSKPSKLDAHAETIAAWFGGPEKLSLAEAQSRLAALGCSVSTGRLSEWWAARQTRTAIDQALASVATGARMGREIEAAFAKNPAPELKLLVSLVKNLILNLTLKGAADPDALAAASELMKRVLDFAKLEAKDRDLALTERRVALLEQQAEKVRAAVTAAKQPGGLTPAALAEIEQAAKIL